MKDVSAKAYNTSANCGEAIVSEHIRAYNVIATYYKTLGRDAIKNLSAWKKAIPQFEDVALLAGFLTDRIEQMTKALFGNHPDGSVSSSTPAPSRYDLKTLNEHRAEALVAYMKETGKRTLKSIEARVYLESIEHRRLDRKTVWRAMRTAQGILRASKDIVSGIVRLVLPAGVGQPGCEEVVEEIGGTPPRRRGWGVPWDG